MPYLSLFYKGLSLPWYFCCSVLILFSPSPDGGWHALTPGDTFHTGSIGYFWDALPGYFCHCPKCIARILSTLPALHSSDIYSTQITLHCQDTFNTASTASLGYIFYTITLHWKDTLNTAQTTLPLHFQHCPARILWTMSTMHCHNTFNTVNTVLPGNFNTANTELPGYFWHCQSCIARILSTLSALQCLDIF